MASDRIPRIPDDPLPFDPLNTIIPDDVTVVAVLVVVLILIAVIMRLRKKKVPTDREQLLNPEKKESANQLLVVVLILIAVIMRLSKNREQLPSPTLLELEQLHNPTLLENRTYTSGSYRTAPDSHRGTGDSHRGTGNSHRTAPDSYRTATEQLPIATEQRGHSMEVEELNGLMDGRGICTYTKKELAKATDNFTTEVGQGASGFVYRANLPGNRMGAVKRAMNLDLIGRELFKQELSVLVRLPRHPHLVDFIGLCLQEGERILVFEFISNGNLHERLHKNKGVSSPLSWAARMDIAYQVAVALQYLHEEAKPPILHRDVKSANVLLVDDHYAKLADFGLSKLGPKNNQFTITAVRGSHGYMDPQYMKTRRYSAKSDVYSFGVVLLELITGLKSLHDDTPLAEWTQPYRSEGIDRFKTIVDPNMIPHINMMELQNMFKIVNVCLAEISEERSSMREILNMMQETRNINSNEAPSLGNGNVSNEAPSLGNGNVSNEAPSLPNVCLAEISEERSSMGEILNMMKETGNINSNEAPSLGNGNVSNEAPSLGN